MLSGRITHTKLFCLVSASIFLTFGLGCGGGTSGSGIRSFEGDITDESGSPLGNVRVTITATGDSALTDASGQFLIESDAGGSEVPFILESPKFLAHFTLSGINQDSSRVSVRLKVDTKTDEVEISHFSVKVGIVGACNVYFENGEVIRQANRVPPGTRCAMNIQVLGDGVPRGNIPVALQYNSCTPGGTWETLQQTVTGIGKFRGEASLDFEFIDSATFCRYRVVAPFNYGNYRPVAYPIDTFTEQEFSAKTKK